MTLLAAASTPFINWSALWRIVVASLIGGAGVVFLFGILLYGLKLRTAPRAREAGSPPTRQRGMWRDLHRHRCGRDLRDGAQAGVEAGPDRKSKSAAVYEPAASSTKLIAYLP